MTTKTRKITRIIACEVFKPALEHLRLVKRYPDLRVTYLPPVLHTRPQKLRKYLLRKIATSREKDEFIICLYGECIPDISDFCQYNKVKKVPGHSCYEILLGTERFRRFTDETAGTYFREKDLLLNFRKYCIEPLELHDKEMREYYFKHYKKLLYIRQPTDPDLRLQACQLADFLKLSLVISDADYSHLEKALIKLL
jgi:hypothetical protein